MKKCHCGKELHYTSAETQKLVEQMVKDLGEFMAVTVDGRTFLVQRHYLALHGLKGIELKDLGFEEITEVH